MEQQSRTLRRRGRRGGHDLADGHVDGGRQIVQPQRRGVVLEPALELCRVGAGNRGRGAARAAQDQCLAQLVGAPVVDTPVRAVPGVGVAPSGVVREGRLAVDREAALAPAIDVGGASGVAVELGGSRQGHECLLTARHRELGGAARDVEPVASVRGGGVGPRSVVRVPVVPATRAGRLSELQTGVGDGGRSTGPVRGLLLRVLRGVGREGDRAERNNRGGGPEQGGHTHTFHALYLSSIVRRQSKLTGPFHYT